MRERAKSLRREMTDAERRLWSALRAHRLGGLSFRRQVPMGPFVADFVCQELRLIIEIDGGQHFESAQEMRDARRSTFLTSKGFRVLRFNNYDVITNRAGVMEMIAAALSEAPSLTLPRKRGRESQSTRGLAS